MRKNGTEKSSDFMGPSCPHTFSLFSCFPAQYVWPVHDLVRMGSRTADKAVLVRRWQAWEAGDPGDSKPEVVFELAEEWSVPSQFLVPGRCGTRGCVQASLELHTPVGRKGAQSLAGFPGKI